MALIPRPRPRSGMGKRQMGTCNVNEAAHNEAWWFFREASAALGFQGQNVENGGGGAHAVDENKMHELHMSMLAQANKDATDQLSNFILACEDEYDEM